MTEVLGYIAIIIIGIVLGAVGAGGSMLATPVLVYLFALSMETASAYSLFLVGMTSLAGVAIKRKEHFVIGSALTFGIPSLAGAFVARKWIITCIPHCIARMQHFHLTKETLLLLMFSLMMIGSSLLLLRQVKSNNNRVDAKPYALIPAGLITGLLAGLMGAGGGFLILPSLLIFARLHFAPALGTTLLIISCNSLLGFCGDVLNHDVNWPFLLSITGLAIAGLFIGYWSHERLPSKRESQRGLAWCMMAIGIFVFCKQIAVTCLL